MVRLKGGDPLIFGRAGEEIAACRKAGIAIEVVPGITAAQGAAARLGVSLTQRKEARRVQYVTGHGSDGRLPHDIDWRSLADPNATTVVYMPGKTLAELAASAVVEGLDPAHAGGRSGAGDAARRGDRRGSDRKTCGPTCGGGSAGAGRGHDRLDLCRARCGAGGTARACRRGLAQLTRLVHAITEPLRH